MHNLADIWSQLLAQKAAVQTEIGKTTDNVQLRRLHEWIGRMLDLEVKHDGLLTEAERLIRQRQNGSPEATQRNPGPSKKMKDTWNFQDLPKQERAVVARRSYLKSQEDRGNYFEKIKGKTIYRRKNDGSHVGITFSIHKKQDNAWFLGLPLPRNSFQEAVLLCQCGPRSVNIIHLPKQICEEYVPQLSENKSQVIFNIVREGGAWHMDIPSNSETVNISRFVDPDELDCSRENLELI